MVLACAPLAAQPYPARPLRIVLPYGPGGNSDIIARVVAQHMSQRLGQQVIVDNRPGAGGIIATEIARKAEPDGYTLLWLNTGHAVSASLYKSLPYDPVRDFVPVSTIGFSGLALVVNASSPVRGVKELVSTAKARPDRFNIGVTFVGSTNHLAAELFKSLAGLEVQVVPFKTTPALIAGVTSGESQAVVEFLPPVLPFVRSGALRALGVTSERRSANLPDVPTLAEAGLPGFEASAWNGLAVPVKTPGEVIAKLNGETRGIVAMPAVRQRLRDLDADARASTPEEFRRILVADIEKWRRVIDRAKIERR
ncbi:MAG: tripartite tricarboxylate transporter substrate binding protein [Burkholderiales bacterium]|nr:tripartite tricarboxylate transporter substrate binding protein [Burkholderiales bacterium]